MATATDALMATWQLPTLDVDGVVYTGTGYPRLKDGIAFIEAVEAKASLGDQLKGARAVLLACGFDAEVVDEMPMAPAIEAATRFFVAGLQPQNGLAS